MPKYKKKGVAAGVGLVDAAGFNGFNYRDFAAGLGLPWYPGAGTLNAMTDPSTGQLMVIAGNARVPVLPGNFVVNSGSSVAVLDLATFKANYDPV